MERLNWIPDHLGDGFEMATISQPDDYRGEVVATIIRRLAPDDGGRGVLYVHGFSDYFFQAELAGEFVARGYSFYAVDLRKYGRSHLPHQPFFEVRSLTEYFPDIDAAIAAMAADGIKAPVLLGHSTGGLTASLYMAMRKDSPVRALILNSPFLAWNMPRWQESLMPVLALLGRIWPSLPIPQPKDIRYARSLRKGLEGRWKYNTDWKPDQMPDVDAGWVRAIELAQRRLRRGADIRVPILLLTSSQSAGAQDPMEKFHRADGVLAVAKIRRVGLTLGPDVTAVTVTDGLHDLALSAPEPRAAFLEAVFRFLAQRVY